MYDKRKNDAFVDEFQKIGKIDIKKSKDEDGQGIKIITISTQGKTDATIKIDSSNNIIGYENENIESIGDDFLYYNKTLKELSLPQVQIVGDYFFRSNKELIKLSLPQLQSVGEEFLYLNERLKELSLPQLQVIGRSFLRQNEVLIELRLPKLIQEAKGKLNIFLREILAKQEASRVIENLKERDEEDNER